MLKQLCYKKGENCFASWVWVDQCQLSCADDMVLFSQIPWDLKHLLEDLAFLSVELLVLICIWHGFVLSNSSGSEASVKGFSMFLSEGMWLKFRTIKSLHSSIAQSCLCGGLVTTCIEQVFYFDACLRVVNRVSEVRTLRSRPASNLCLKK